MTARLGGALACVLVLAACGSSDNVSEKRLSGLVVQQSDLPHAFVPFSNGPQARLDNQGSARADATRFGRKGGWIARYHRPGSVQARGPLVVESRADVFSAASGAKSDLGLYRVDFTRIPALHRSVPVPQLGDEAIGATFTQPGSVKTHFYRIAWRDRNVTASILVDGFHVDLADAVSLARKQERLIAES